MVNEMDKCIRTEAAIIMFVKEKEVSVQSNIELYKKNIINNYK
jgi:hypothetical protein